MPLVSLRLILLLLRPSEGGANGASARRFHDTIAGAAAGSLAVGELTAAALLTLPPPAVVLLGERALRAAATLALVGEDLTIFSAALALAAEDVAVALAVVLASAALPLPPRDSLKFPLRPLPGDTKVMRVLPPLRPPPVLGSGSARSSNL